MNIPDYMHADEAEKKGWMVDYHAAGRPLAYKGPRFRTTERCQCFTELESQLIRHFKLVTPAQGEHIRRIIEQCRELDTRT